MIIHEHDLDVTWVINQVPIVSQNILTKPLIPRLIGLEFHCRHKLVTNPVKLWKLLGKY